MLPNRYRFHTALPQGVAWAFLLVLPLISPAREANIDTRDRKSYFGHVRLDTNYLVVANADKGYIVEIGLTNLLTVRFKPAPPPAFANEALASSALPSPWQSDDIGGVRVLGSASFDSGVFHVNTCGTNVVNDSDSFRFVYKQVSGSSEIMARVIQVRYTAPSAKAGVMIRASLAADSPTVLLGVSAGWRGSLQWREAKGASLNQTVQRDLSVPCWIKLKRDGDAIIAYKSRNGRRWWLVDRLTLPMAEDFFVGLAASSGNAERMGRATFDNVREAPTLPKTSFVPRTRLRSGSVLIGSVEAVDDETVHFADPLVPEVATPQVASLVFDWVPYRLADPVEAGRPGVLLNDGTFVEGDVRALEKGYVHLSSVLYGSRQYDVNNEVIAVVLRPAHPAPQPCTIKTAEGSTWLAATVQFGWNEVVIQEPALGRRAFGLHELLEINWRK